jgi:hypothetical protein
VRTQSRCELGQRRFAHRATTRTIQPVKAKLATLSTVPSIRPGDGDIKVASARITVPVYMCDAAE